MYVQIRLLNGFRKNLTYKIPCHLISELYPGSFVTVPLKTYKTLGWVVNIQNDLANTPLYEIKEIINVIPFARDEKFHAFLKALSSYYVVDERYFISRLRSFLVQKKIEKQSEKLSENNDCIATKPTLTSKQQLISDSLKTAITKKIFASTLLHGVTGSGKTEIYKTLILHCIKEEKSVILLVPEVTLAVQFCTLLRAELPNWIHIYHYHSASDAQEKKKLRNSLITSESSVIIGVHLPIMLPVGNLGLIIVDEEHELGYQEKKHPKINSKEAALLRAQFYNIPILLGSATPSVTSLYQVKQKRWNFFSLEKRFAGEFPKISIIYLLKNKKRRKYFWLSSELLEGISKRLELKEQCIIFLNRRGYSFFVMCKKCEYVFHCTSCSVSLTLHSDNTIRCHYCNYHNELPAFCLACNADQTEFLKKGIGTQQVVTLLKEAFPTARIGRADLDTTINKKKWQKTIETFKNRELDILVGTQMITKGYHFPGVTLVGIIWADANIHLPHYNATEAALQQLIQVAGRAGRQSSKSIVIVQTLIEHTLFQYIEEVNYLKFYDNEIKKRRLSRYPPFVRLSEIEIRAKDENVLEREAHILAEFLEINETLTILGPTAPPIAKIKNMHSRIIYIKSPSLHLSKESFLAAKKSFPFTCSIFFTPNT